MKTNKQTKNHWGLAWRMVDLVDLFLIPEGFFCLFVFVFGFFFVCVCLSGLLVTSIMCCLQGSYAAGTWICCTAQGIWGLFLCAAERHGLSLTTKSALTCTAFPLCSLHNLSFSRRCTDTHTAPLNF